MTDPLAAIRRLRERPAAERPRPGECCDLCGEAIPDEHGHLVDLKDRGLRCACRGCYLLFLSDGAGGRRYRAVPDRHVRFAGLQLTSQQWELLQIPVSVAFFFVNSELGRVAAFYPSPAGATESLLPLDTWGEVVAANPGLAMAEPDVEAILLRAGRGGVAAGVECYLVPIDACYELVGQLRRLWRGFDGGREANAALDGFFDRVRARASVVSG